MNENPLPLEGHAISTTATVISVTDTGSYYSVVVSEGATLVLPLNMTPPLGGQRLLVRGTSWLHTNGSIFVHEFYALDYSSSLIRSVPGIVIFVILFFMTFKIDFRKLAFTERKEDDKDA